jgi:hypothetical protein
MQMQTAWHTMMANQKTFSGKDLKILGVNGHLHQLGKSWSVIVETCKLVTGNYFTDCSNPGNWKFNRTLYNQTAYDFNSQTLFEVDSYFYNYERLVTSCAWDTRGKTEYVYGGEESSEEMCVVWTYYYPAVALGNVCFMGASNKLGTTCPGNGVSTCGQWCYDSTFAASPWFGWNPAVQAPNGGCTGCTTPRCTPVNGLCVPPGLICPTRKT